MAERRSLANLLSNPVPGVDSDLVRSFVTQNVSCERPIPEPLVPIEPRPITNADSAPVFGEAEAKPSLQKPKRGNRFQPVGLIPVTVRLRPEIAGALKRASLERELAGEDVFTQQNLVEQVLEPWLSSEGYL
jgi:hypothetical protein